MLVLPHQAAQQVSRRYRNQARAWLKGEGDFPYGIALGMPTEQAARDDPAAVRAWVTTWQRWDGAGRVIWEERVWPRLGPQRLPARIVFDTDLSAAAFAGEGPRYGRARRRYDAMSVCYPALAGVALARHFGTLADASDADFEWLEAMLGWLVGNPGSGRYLREIPVGGLDTKWVAPWLSVLADWVEAIRGQPRDGENVHAFLGLRIPPARLRLRALDPTLSARIGGLSDIETPLEDAAALTWRPRCVLVVENLTTGLALPPLGGVVAMIGMGNAAPAALAGLPWVQSAERVIHWGDLDTHGLAILARARQAVPKIESLLMDADTLLAHEKLWTQEPVQYNQSLPNALTEAERALFDALRADRYGERVRLEQERINWVEALVGLRALGISSVRSDDG